MANLVEKRVESIIKRFSGSKVMAIWFQETLIETLKEDYQLHSEFQEKVLASLEAYKMN